MSEFGELKRSFELDPFLSLNMHKTSEILNFHLEVLKISQGKKTNLKNFGGCRQGGRLCSKFYYLKSLSYYLISREARENFQKSTALFISKNFFIYLSGEFNLAVLEEGIVSYTHQTRLL